LGGGVEGGKGCRWGSSRSREKLAGRFLSGSLPGAFVSQRGFFWHEIGRQEQSRLRCMPDAKTAVLPRKDGFWRSADGRNLGRQRSEIYTPIHVNHRFFLPPTANSCQMPGTPRLPPVTHGFRKRVARREFPTWV